MKEGDTVENLVKLAQLSMLVNLLRVFSIVFDILPELQIHMSDGELHNIWIINGEETRRILVNFALLEEFLWHTFAL